MPGFRIPGGQYHAGNDGTSERDGNTSDDPDIDRSTAPTTPDSNQNRPKTAYRGELRANKRPKLKPIPKADRKTRPYVPPEYEPWPCGLSGHHELICGHWIFDDSPRDKNGRYPGMPCAANCKKANLNEAAFACPQCRTIAEEVLNNLGPEENAKLQTAMNMGPPFEPVAIAYMVEFITKTGKIPSGATDVVLCVKYPTYGRSCQQAEEKKGVMWVDMFQEVNRFKARRAVEEANSRGHKRAPPFDSNTSHKRVKLNKDGNQSEAAPVNLKVPVEALVPCRKRKAAVTDLVLHDRQTKRDRTG